MGGDQDKWPRALIHLVIPRSAPRVDSEASTLVSALYGGFYPLVLPRALNSRYLRSPRPRMRPAAVPCQIQLPHAPSLARTARLASKNAPRPLRFALVAKGGKVIAPSPQWAYLGSPSSQESYFRLLLFLNSFHECYTSPLPAESPVLRVYGQVVCLLPGESSVLETLA